MIETHTDPATGHQYTVDTETGTTAWVGPPPPAPTDPRVWQRDPSNPNQNYGPQSDQGQAYPTYPGGQSAPSAPTGQSGPSAPTGQSGQSGPAYPASQGYPAYPTAQGDPTAASYPAGGPVNPSWQAPPTTPGAPPAPRKRRVFLWVFLAVQAIFVILIIVLGSSTTNADCENLTQAQCDDLGATATGLGVLGIVLAWVIVDFLLAMGYFIYRLAKRP